MMDDRVCPACDVILPAGAETCTKCGRDVHLKTGLSFIDLPTRIHPWFVRRFGSVWGGVGACVPFLLLLAFVVVKLAAKLGQQN